MTIPSDPVRPAPRRPAVPLGGEAPRWGARFRRAPLGVITLSALLAILGAALALGGLWLGLSGGTAGWAAWAVGLGAGPLAVYLALQLASLTRWAWMTLVGLCVLLMVSSVARLVAVPGLQATSLGELAVEAALLLYLLRPPVRRAFGAPGVS